MNDEIIIIDKDLKELSSNAKTSKEIMKNDTILIASPSIPSIKFIALIMYNNKNCKHL